MQSGDTIAAISSATGSAARMIVRMSGPDAISIASKCLREPTGVATSVAMNLLQDNLTRANVTVRDCSYPAWVYLFRSPNSVTSEDVVEFHIPGNPLLARWTLEAMILHGARQADAGEFTARAYFNGKLDLAQAEGVSATVSAHSEAELSAARQLLAGELSRRLKPVMEEIAHTLALVEAGIDFTEEDISFIPTADAVARIDRVIDTLNHLVKESPQFEPLTHWPKVVLVGRPNAGKSTLLNALAGHERAVVSPVAGTTRDVLSATVTLARGAIQLFDVAGLEESPDASEASVHSQIARDMQRRANAALEEADFVVHVRELFDSSETIALPRSADVQVITKLDLPRSVGVPPTEIKAGPWAGRPRYGGAEIHLISVSAMTGEGLDELRAALDELVFSREGSQTLALNARHLQCINGCIDALSRARISAATQGSEILASDLRDALDLLGRVLGEVTPDDVLGRVFATFCIGK